jgi:hypothetical protein
MPSIPRLCLAIVFVLGVSVTQLSNAASTNITFRNAPGLVTVGQKFEFFVQVRTQSDDAVLSVGVVDGDVPLVLSQIDLQQNTQPQHRFVWAVYEVGDFYLVGVITNGRDQITARRVAELHVLSR